MAKGKKTEKSSKVSKPLRTAIKRIVRAEAAEEVKYWDTRAVTTTIGNNTDWYFQDLCLVPQGTTDTSRVGDSLKMRNLQLNYHLETGAGFKTSAFRIVVAQFNGDSVLSTPAQIAALLFHSPGITAGYDSLSHYQHDNVSAKKFNILFDKMYSSAGSTNTDAMFGRVNIPLKYARKNLQYNGGATTGSDHLYIFALTDQPVASLDQFAYTARLEFTDS